MLEIVPRPTHLVLPLYLPLYLAVCLVIGVTALSGCRRGEPEYHVHGNVTFDGLPIPAGSLIFEADVAHGNSGPSGHCQITDGKFDTRAQGGRGTVGGPHIVHITGLSGGTSPTATLSADRTLSAAIPMFPTYSITVNLPQEVVQTDFDVPLSAAVSQE